MNEHLPACRAALVLVLIWVVLYLPVFIKRR